MKRWHDRGRDSHHEPANDAIRDRNLVNVAPLQLGEE